MHLPVGHIVNSRYRIINVLGQGGFGITYLAEDLELHRNVALKELFIAGNSQRTPNQTVISRSLEGIPFSAFVDRFIREARQIAQFEHENIIKVYEYFEDNGTAYFAMEYVSGMSLQELVKINGPLAGKQATDVINSLLSAVSELHEKGVIHRDIKPANVMISDRWRVVLIDFGTARTFEDGRTVSTVAMVSGGYSPWEQYGESGQLTKQSDIYAIGATMYFLLTGKKPLAAPDRMGTEMESPQQIEPSISSSISQSVMKAMAFNPADRFPTIQAFRKALQVGVSIGESQKKHRKETVFNAYSRIDRITYLVRVVAICAIMVGLFVLTHSIVESTRDQNVIMFFTFIWIGVMLYLWVLIFFQLSKRLQDTGSHGAYSLFALIPYLGAVLFLIMLFVPGQKNDNQYGKRPR